MAPSIVLANEGTVTNGEKVIDTGDSTVIQENNTGFAIIDNNTDEQQEIHSIMIITLKLS